ncbi:FAD-dependent oxidoreductase [Novosphingobium rosa]|uniref:FAD-dependent oxidoreductase n=1 Tax=Novosphingobium rosa TaxID=76978 RepID=UPI000830D11E|nr:FAD-dependent oxidoreductase [Novosphingobium rosa]
MSFDSPFDRRRLLGHSLAAGGLVSLSGCVSGAGGPAMASRIIGAAPSLAPMRASVDRITDIKVCLRPFRPQGPRLDTEMLGDTLVIHNYGHGGSGWSLSWGSAEVAVGKAAAALPDRLAVVGCGIIGLTSAVMAQRAGMQVTIYTKEVFSRTRSVRANGSWTPDSRIALTAPAGEAFGALWERMARFSWKSFRSYLGLPGNPVDFADNYRLSDEPFTAREEEEAPPPGKGSYASTGMPQDSSEFASYGERIADITPGHEVFASGSTPFAAPYVRRSSNMFFNFSTYGHYLMQEFLENGGKIEIREFHEPGELAQLKEKVVINCPGYAARDLWRDSKLIPVRGQTAWLIPQAEVHYGIYTNNVSALSKADGLMIQGFNGLGDMEGVGDSSELPDRAESEAAVEVIRKAFMGFKFG